jgi:WD40 repeat protein
MTVAVRVDPFPGLRSFEPDEDHLFFGRETHVDEVLGRLRRTRFLAVVGGSGSGKSSLVKSGLIPSLCGGYMVQAGSSWRVAVMRPGADPIQGLTAALNAPDVLGGDQTSADLTAALLEASLRRSGQGLVDAVRQRRLPAGENLLVIVDQFEELFRFKQARAATGGRDEAVAFVKLLLEAAGQDEIPVYVVLTMRSEFIGSCAEFPGLPEAVNEGQYLVPRMTRDQLRLAITGPVAVAGGEMAPRLVTRLLNEVGDDPDQLPVLQHALMRTWNHWSSHGGARPIDFGDYEAIGTMRGALSRHAEEAYDEIATARGTHLAEVVFKALTETTGQGLGLRRPCRVHELCAVAAASLDEIASAIDRFRIAGRSFLVPSIDTPLLPETIVDLSHESLMRLWDRLVEWTQQEARSAELYRRLAAAALLHARGEAGLWRDPELQLTVNWRDTQRPTEAWARRYDPQFDRASAFLAASVETRDADAAVRDAEAAARRLSERRVQRLTRAVLVISVLALAGVWRFWSVARANETEATQLQSEADIASQAAMLATASADSAKRDAATALTAVAAAQGDAQAETAQALVDADYAKAVAASRTRTALGGLLATGISEDLRDNPWSIGTVGLLAIEALRIDASTPLARHILMDVIQLLPPAPVVRHGHRGAVRQMAVDASGDWLATYGDDGAVVLWDFRTREIQRTIAEQVPPLTDLLISADGQWVVAASQSEVEVWESDSGRRVAHLPLARPQSIALSPDRSLLAVVLKGQYKLFRTADWTEVPRGPYPFAINRVLFSAAGSEIFETATGMRFASGQADIDGTLRCHSARLDAAGRLIARCRYGFVEFGVTGDSLERKSAVPVPKEIGEVWLNRRDATAGARQFVVAQSAAGVAVFDREGNEHLRFPRPLSKLAVPSRGEWIASGDEHGAVMFWRLAHPMAQAVPYSGDLSDLTFSQDERLLGVAGRDGRVAIFETDKQTVVASVQLSGAGRLESPRFSPDGSIFVVRDANRLRALRTSDWTELPQAAVKAASERPGLSYFFSAPGGNLVVTQPGLVRRVRARPWTPLGSFDTNPDATIYVSQNRQWLAVVDAKRAGDSASRFFAADSGQPVPAAQIPRPLMADGRSVSRASWPDYLSASPEWVRMPDSANRLSGDGDGGAWWTLDLKTLDEPVVNLNETLTGHKVAELEHDSPVRAVAISRQGNWVATASDDGKLFLWPWNQEKLLQLTCSLLPENLTPHEWDARHLEKLGLGPYRATCGNLPLRSAADR